MKYWNWVLPLSVCVAVLLVVFVYVIPTRENDRDYEIDKQLRDLESTKLLLEKDNKQLERKIELLIYQADSLGRLLQKDSTMISNLKKVKHERVQAIADYSNDELFEFFARFNSDSTRGK